MEKTREQGVEKGLSGNQLKMIAIVAMLVDHLAWVVHLVLCGIIRVVLYGNIKTIVG